MGRETGEKFKGEIHMGTGNGGNRAAHMLM